MTLSAYIDSIMESHQDLGTDQKQKLIRGLILQYCEEHLFVFESITVTADIYGAYVNIKRTNIAYQADILKTSYRTRFGDNHIRDVSLAHAALIRINSRITDLINANDDYLGIGLSSLYVEVMSAGDNNPLKNSINKSYGAKTIIIFSGVPQQ